MTTRITLSHNVGGVIDDLEDVKDDLRYEFRKRVGAAMQLLLNHVRRNIIHDPHYRGALLRSVQSDTDVGTDTIEFTVGVKNQMVEYAKIVEYGSGSRSDVAPMIANLQEWDYPSGYPYDSPDISYNKENPLQTNGFPKFYGFTKYIEEWLRTKPVAPRSGDYFVSAAYIAATIIEKGNFAHPFLRPAWFRQEPNIKKAARNALRNAVR